MCDILWSDPCDEFQNEDPQKVMFEHNEVRQCSYKFGLKPVKSLLKREKMLCLIRAHEVKQDGYELCQWEDPDDFPLVITVFSAPNYCNSYMNRAAVITVSN